MLLLGFHKRCPHSHPPPPRNGSHSVLLNKGKQNTRVYACVKRSCRHVQDLVVRIIVRWIMETHRYRMHNSMNIYCTKKLVAWRVRQRLANRKVWNLFKLLKPALKRPTKHLQPPDHPPPLSSLTLLLQVFSASLKNWSWNQAKSASYCLLYIHSSPRWKMTAFLRQLHRLVEL